MPSDKLSVLSATNIQSAARRFGLAALPIEAAEQLSAFAILLLRWNARLNLTALRTPEQILSRHLLESIFCAQNLAGDPETLLDFGSGAGLPGIPIAICRPATLVTLAEASTRKASFLREACRTLALGARVYGGRVEELPLESTFDAVTMRAVDRMHAALAVASSRVAEGGLLVLLSTGAAAVPVADGFELASAIPVPESQDRLLLQHRRISSIPRGT
ncbi:MAG TPA: 16S rRNA (guanine(527)-N(7))-methyltransferase RsmG [Acidisarcina sp.]